MNHYFLLLLGCMFFITSCKVEPQPIEYNMDECAFCKMKISDTRFGAELVTKKGKVFKYDSAECLLRVVQEEGLDKFEHKIVTDYHHPKTFIDATTATFLISEKRPSPMGGNLSTYEKKDAAQIAMSELGGTLYTFEDLIKTFNRN